MKYIITIVLLSFTFLVNAQMPSPVKWTAELVEEGDNQYISIQADMDKEWVVYSQHMSDEGPIPTAFEYRFEGKGNTEGNTEELSEVIVKYSDLFEMDVKKFKGEAKYKQNIKTAGHGTVSVDVTFMTCSGNKCLPPKTETIEIVY